MNFEAKWMKTEFAREYLLLNIPKHGEAFFILSYIESPKEFSRLPRSRVTSVLQILPQPIVVPDPLLHNVGTSCHHVYLVIYIWSNIYQHLPIY
jgi:hypothetical protein